jgi:hypothetical protein
MMDQFGRCVVQITVLAPPARLSATTRCLTIEDSAKRNSRATQERVLHTEVKSSRAVPVLATGNGWPRNCTVCMCTSRGPSRAAGASRHRRVDHARVHHDRQWWQWHLQDGQPPRYWASRWDLSSVRVVMSAIPLSVVESPVSLLGIMMVYRRRASWPRSAWWCPGYPSSGGRLLARRLPFIRWRITRWDGQFRTWTRPSPRGECAKEWGVLPIQSQGVGEVRRIRTHVLTQVHAIDKPTGIFTQEPLQCRAVEPRSKRIHSRSIVFTTRKLKHIATGGARRRRVAERLIGVLRLNNTRSVDQSQRGSKRIC